MKQCQRSKKKFYALVKLTVALLTKHILVRRVVVPIK